jgi:hypothetical protein
VIPLLDECVFHGRDNCTCPAWLVVLGCMDRELEQRLEDEENAEKAK